ncbi:membrane protein [Streptomyces sp. SPB074]|nr:membrane protein [Streptomyces sp. SPB074]
MGASGLSALLILVLAAQLAADKESSVEKHDGREAGQVRLDDPWRDSLASGWNGTDGARAPAPTVPAPASEPEPARRAADVYLEVQHSPAFQEVRRRYRSFAFPAAAAFFLWYVAYVVAATMAPDLMGRPVAGVINIAMVAGLAQFLTTFLLTWAYARHARLRRDRAALELRWDTQEMTRGVRR